MTTFRALQPLKIIFGAILALILSVALIAVSVYFESQAAIKGRVEIEEFLSELQHTHPAGTRAVTVIRYLNEKRVRYVVFERNAKIRGIDIIFDDVDRKFWPLSKTIIRVILTFDDEERLIMIEKREQRYIL